MYEMAQSLHLRDGLRDMKTCEVAVIRPQSGYRQIRETRQSDIACVN
jgi:hypothetical protein